MSNEAEFIRQIRDALTHLYDYAYLQKHPLADSLIPPQATASRTKAQELRRILLDAIEALNPGDNIPIRALERRGYAILFGLYVEGRERREMADSLGISGRQLRRDRGAAFEALVSILQDRYPHHLPPPRSSTPAEEPLRSESERLAEQREALNLYLLINGLLSLLEPMAQKQGVQLSSHIEPDWPELWANRTLVRQILIGLASHALANLPLARLIFEMRTSKTKIDIGLNFKYRSGNLQEATKSASLPSILKSVKPLVVALEGQLCREQTVGDEESIWLSLPRQGETLVLVVDDNRELFALFQRYVTGYPYRLIHAASVDQALALVQSSRPDVITLDLMMPERDGWELLQELQAHPDTADIPVAVCSILDDPELAFSWGAQIYLKKPVGSVELLQALAEAVQ